MNINDDLNFFTSSSDFEHAEEESDDLAKSLSSGSLDSFSTTFEDVYEDSNDNESTSSDQSPRYNNDLALQLNLASLNLKEDNEDNDDLCTAKSSLSQFQNEDDDIPISNTILTKSDCNLPLFFRFHSTDFQDQSEDFQIISNETTCSSEDLQNRNSINSITFECEKDDNNDTDAETTSSTILEYDLEVRALSSSRHYNNRRSQNKNIRNTSNLSFTRSEDNLLFLSRLSWAELEYESNVSSESTCSSIQINDAELEQFLSSADFDNENEGVDHTPANKSSSIPTNELELQPSQSPNDLKTENFNTFTPSPRNNLELQRSGSSISLKYELEDNVDSFTEENFNPIPRNTLKLVEDETDLPSPSTFRPRSQLEVFLNSRRSSSSAENVELLAPPSSPNCEFENEDLTFTDVSARTPTDFDSESSTSTSVANENEDYFDLFVQLSSSRSKENSHSPNRAGLEDDDVDIMDNVPKKKIVTTISEDNIFRPGLSSRSLTDREYENTAWTVNNYRVTCKSDLKNDENKDINMSAINVMRVRSENNIVFRPGLSSKSFGDAENQVEAVNNCGFSSTNIWELLPSLSSCDFEDNNQDISTTKFEEGSELKLSLINLEDVNENVDLFTPKTCAPRETNIEDESLSLKTSSTISESDFQLPLSSRSINYEDEFSSPREHSSSTSTADLNLRLSSLSINFEDEDSSAPGKSKLDHNIRLSSLSTNFEDHDNVLAPRRSTSDLNLRLSSLSTNFQEDDNLCAPRRSISDLNLRLSSLSTHFQDDNLLALKNLKGSFTSRSDMEGTFLPLSAFDKVILMPRDFKYDSEENSDFEGCDFLLSNSSGSSNLDCDFGSSSQLSMFTSVYDDKHNDLQEVVDPNSPPSTSTNDNVTRLTNKKKRTTQDISSDMQDGEIIDTDRDRQDLSPVSEQEIAVPSPRTRSCFF